MRVGSEPGYAVFGTTRKLLFIANELTQHHIGLEATADGIWSIYFGIVLLPKIDEWDMILRDGSLLPLALFHSDQAMEPTFCILTPASGAPGSSGAALVGYMQR